MANLNKVMLIGRLTKDPEVKTFSSGNSVSKFSIAVNNRKKSSSGEWQDDPVFIDCDAFGKTSDLVQQYLSKGKQIFLEGKLKLDSWTDTSGNKRSKMGVIVDSIQFIDSKDTRSRELDPQDEVPVQKGFPDPDDTPF
jgi:single-strand DNA-binding protein